MAKRTSSVLEEEYDAVASDSELEELCLKPWKKSKNDNQFQDSYLAGEKAKVSQFIHAFNQGDLDAGDLVYGTAKNNRYKICYAMYRIDHKNTNRI